MVNRNAQNGPRWSLWRQTLPVLIVLVFVTWGSLRTLARLSPTDTEPYHARIRAEADKIPAEIGDWVGKEEDMPPEAIKILRPNVLVSWVYRDRFHPNQKIVTFLVSQTADSRDMGGHYPPACYPNNGWEQISASPPQTWQLGDLTIEGREYVFEMQRPMGGANRLTIRNFMILPTGEFTGDIREVRKLAADYEAKFYGAGQIQLIYQGAVFDERERDEIFQEILSPNIGLIKAILNGIPDDERSESATRPAA